MVWKPPATLLTIVTPAVGELKTKLGLPIIFQSSPEKNTLKEGNVFPILWMKFKDLGL